MRTIVLVLAVLLALPACSNVTGPDLPDFMQGSGGMTAPELDIPGQYTASGASSGRQGDEAAVPPNEAQLRAAFEQRNRQATSLWNRAEAAQGSGTKADIYETIADDFPEYPRAAEARFRQGLNLYRGRDWMASIEALKQYMAIAPVNSNIPQVEEMIYNAGLNELRGNNGFFSIFMDDGDALDALRYVALTFPAGEYPDDALLAVGRYYQRDPEELQRAMLYFKELLLRYPDSEWSFEARRALGDTYALRDQGVPYHAGFVDRDPREPVQGGEEAEAFAGPVRSGLVMAVEEYDKYLERIERDPGRQAEYQAQVQRVENSRRCAREALAQKDLRTARWYAARGEQRAAEVYRRAARMWRGQCVEPLPTADCRVPFPGASAPSAVPGPSSPGGVATPPPGTVQPGVRPSSPGTQPPVWRPPSQRPGGLQPPPPPTPGAGPTVPVVPPINPGTNVPSQPVGSTAPPPPPPPNWGPGR